LLLNICDMADYEVGLAFRFFSVEIVIWVSVVWSVLNERRGVSKMCTLYVRWVACLVRFDVPEVV
jgi:hypothetical protein